MNYLRLALAAVLALGVALPDVASADRGRIGRHHSHSRLGVHIGIPLFWGWPGPYYGYPSYRYYDPYPYAYPPYYAYPPIVTVPSSPPVYIERDDDDADGDRKSAGSYWYYCDRPEGYYPYVKECPGGWERVAPRPSR